MPVLVEQNGKWVPETLPDRAIGTDTYTVHRYRPRIEGLFAHIERWTRDADGDVHWRSISKDNILTLYGKDSNSRITDPVDPLRVFTWLICETRDDKGNAVLYEYKPEDGVGVDLTRAHERNRGDRNDPRRATNRYLKQIRYGNRVPLLDNAGHRPRVLTVAQFQNADWMFEVVFDYGEHAANGWLYVVPAIDLKKLEELFRHKVLTMLRREGKIDDALIKKLFGWRHSGFSIHHEVRIDRRDQDGREKLAQYILRAPFSQQKMRYHAKSRTVIYRSKMHRILKRNFEVFPVLDWIAAVTAHIPNKGEHLVRYYGWYSNVNRGKRRKAEESAQQGSPAGMVEIPPLPGSSLFKQRGAELIKKVYAADPRLCPRCGGAMRIIAFIDQPDVIEKILTHLSLWPYASHAPPPGAVA